MNNLRCPECGLVNWSSDESCKRCGGALVSGSSHKIGQPVETSLEESGFSWKKWLLIALLLVIVAIPLFVWRNVRSRNQAMVSAIQNSATFNKLTVEVCRFGGPNAEGENTEALTLRDAGYLFIDEGTKEVPAPYTPSTPPQLWSRQDPRYQVYWKTTPPPPLKVPTVQLGLTATGRAAASDWEPFEDKKASKSGWIVPLGTRELVEVTYVTWKTDGAVVAFSWKWKPNEVGQAFDSSDDELRRNPSMRQKSWPLISSRFPYRATAELTETSTGWELKSIHFDTPSPGSVY